LWWLDLFINLNSLFKLVLSVLLLLVLLLATFNTRLKFCLLLQMLLVGVMSRGGLQQYLP
jgi:hypothetical protein